MINEINKAGQNLTKVPPRSPKVIIGGFAMLGRTIDKCRAELWGNRGEYHFNCPLDQSLFAFKDINHEEFKQYVSEGHTDDEIGEWMKNHGKEKADGEISQWTQSRLTENYSGDKDKKAWLEGENKRLGLHKDGTLFDYLEADDKLSFPSITINLIA
ncbi:MAG TPA: DUF5069 domain-containing protein [Patescibacteria group bacterium]|nr:DUF5069 domain-containing protein [Patescibacteria group bacterium]